MSEVEYAVYEPRRGGLLKSAAGPLVGLVGLAACAAVGLVAVVSIANSRAGARATPDDIAPIAQHMIGSWGFLLAVAAPSLLFVALGGYLSARSAGDEGAKRALPAGLAAAAAAALIVFASPVRVPGWIALALVAAPLPAALVGVGLRRIGAAPARRREPEPEPRAESRFPRPPAHSAEDDRSLTSQVAAAVARQEGFAQPPTDRAPAPQPPAPAARPAPAPRPFAPAARPAEPGKLEALDSLRAAVRAALLTHPAATEEDFERCWPAIRDEIFKQHTLRVYNSRAGRDNGSH